MWTVKREQTNCLTLNKQTTTKKTWLKQKNKSRRSKWHNKSYCSPHPPPPQTRVRPSWILFVRLGPPLCVLMNGRCAQSLMKRWRVGATRTPEGRWCVQFQWLTFCQGEINCPFPMMLQWSDDVSSCLKIESVMIKNTRQSALEVFSCTSFQCSLKRSKFHQHPSFGQVLTQSSQFFFLESCG